MGQGRDNKRYYEDQLAHVTNIDKDIYLAFVVYCRLNHLQLKKTLEGLIIKYLQVHGAADIHARVLEKMKQVASI